jgi:hypothetical protein
VVDGEVETYSRESCMPKRELGSCHYKRKRTSNTWRIGSLEGDLGGGAAPARWCSVKGVGPVAPRASL